MTKDKLTQMLGWASVGLGTPLLMAAGGSARPARAIGIEDGSRQRAILTGVGARELMAAAGLLGDGRPRWLWARVAGDLMDLALLSGALRGRARTPRILKTGVPRGDREGLGRVIAATGTVAAITAVDLYAAVTRSLLTAGREATVSLTAAVTVARPRHEVYAQWRRLEDLPAFMAHLDSVTTTGPGTSHWRASAPFRQSVEWDARVTTDLPGERLGWRSLDGSAIRNEGEVRFVPAPGATDTDPATEVHVRMSYSVPAGKLGQAIARYFGEDPHQQLDDDLRRFKQVLETGEVVRSEGAPWGKRARHEFPQRPARPLTANELTEVHS